jgi:hypothetical protein
MIHDVAWGTWLDKRLLVGPSFFGLDEAMQETGTQAKAGPVDRQYSVRTGKSR